MLSVFTTLVAKHPRLLVQHLQQYADLAEAEAALMAEALKQRVVCAVVAVAAGGVAMVLAGMAVMLYATRLVDDNAAAWVLVLVPAVPAAIALAAALMARARRPATAAFSNLRQQMNEDFAMLQRWSGA